MRFEVVIGEKETCGLVTVRVFELRNRDEAQRDGLGRRELCNDRGTLFMPPASAKAFKSIIESMVVTLTPIEDFGPIAQQGRNGTGKRR